MSGHSILSVSISVCMYPCQKYRRIACVIITIPTASRTHPSTLLWSFHRRAADSNADWLQMIDYRCADCIHPHCYDHFTERAADSTADWFTERAADSPADWLQMIDYRCADCIYLHYYDHFIERAADSTADCVIITIPTASRTHPSALLWPFSQKGRLIRLMIALS